MPGNEINLEVIIIPHDHLINVCKYRSGKSTCKYIVFFSSVNDFCCIKHIPEQKSFIDDIQSGIKAQGDNCPGLFNGIKTA